MFNAETLLKEAKSYYIVFSTAFDLKCPYCNYSALYKKKTFHSLKSLSWHLAHEHHDDVGYPFTLEQIQEILKVLALVKQWGMLA